jgi:succinyl-diaminopimelate desuccinylase
MRPQVDHDSVVAFTRELVLIDSVNRPGEAGGEAEAAAAVAAWMRSSGWDPVTEEVAPGRPNVIARIDGGRPGPTLLFEGHTDVVTEGDRAEWTVDPFGGDIVGGRIYGRGAADMKGGLSAMLHAVRAVADSGEFPGTIVVAVLCDEEELMLGVHDFVRRGHADGVDGAIVCEPEGGEVCATQKGALRLRIDAEGKMAHGAMPHQGKNPLAALGRLLPAIEELESELQTAYGEHPHLGLPYVTPTHLLAGSIEQMNVIPRDAVLSLDIRTIPGIDHDDIHRRLSELAEPIGDELGVDLRISRLVDRCSTETPADDPVVRAVADAHEEVAGEPPAFGGVPGSTDGTILWRDAGVPVVVYGPGGKWIAHQADEYVEIDDLTRSADVYVAAALRFLHGNP